MTRTSIMSRSGPDGSRPASTISLPNGLVCHLPSKKMRRIVETTIAEVFERGRYRRAGFDLGPDDGVIDIGANIGIFTLWAAPQVPRGRILAVEPSPAIEILRSNLGLNRLERVTSLQVAVGKADSEMELVFYPYADVMTHDASLRRSWLMRVLMSGARSERIRVPTASLGQVIEFSKMTRVDYLKVDCEGGEYELCRNATAADWRRVRRVSLEFHEYSPEHRHGEIVDILRANGFEVEVSAAWWQRSLTRTGEIWASRRALGVP